jgi:AcrR family transcriptional regulator
MKAADSLDGRGTRTDGRGTPTDGRGTPTDGRTARRLANRNKVLDTALELAAKGADVDVESIAEASGVSVRSVYNHFPTARHLVAGMYDRGSEKIREHLAELPGPEVPFDERVTRWVHVWARVQEEIAPIRWRALIAEDAHPELQPELAQLRRRHRAEIKRIFPEVAEKSAYLAALAVTDSLTWRAMRKHQGLSVDAASTVLIDTLKRLASPA